jgi:hypothetical protein
MRWFVGLICLMGVWVVGVGVANADDPPSWASPVLVQRLEQTIAAAGQASTPGGGQPDLSADEAKAAFEDAFPQVASADAYSTDALVQHGDIEKVIDPREARVSLDNGKSGVLISSLPLQTDDASGDKVGVDASLQSQGTAYEPAAALADYSVSKDLEQGVQLSDAGVGVAPTGSGVDGAVAHRVGDSVMWANTATDTDFIVTPQPTGVETFEQVRSADAPQSLPLDISLPQDGRIVPSSQLPGGLDVKDSGGQTVTSVSPVMATDADGNTVPASYHLDGDGHTVSIQVEHRGGDVHYPVLVDPTFTIPEYLWDAGANGNYPGWKYSSTSAAGMSSLAGAGIFGSGIYGWFGANLSMPAWSAAVWRFDAPGTSSIVQAQLTSTYWNTAGHSCVWLGMQAMRVPSTPWDAGTSWKTSTGTDMTSLPYMNCAGYAQVMRSLNSTSHYGNNSLVAQIFAYKNGLATVPANANTDLLYLTTSSVVIEDDDIPVASMQNPVTMDAGGSLSFNLTDQGTGISYWKLSSPDHPGWDKATDGTFICTATYAPDWGCPRSHTIGAALGNLPEGPSTIRVNANDPTNNPTQRDYTIIRDRTGPTITPTGTLWEHRNQSTDHRNEGLYDAGYNLHLAVGDTYSAITSVKVTVSGSTPVTITPTTCPTTGGCTQNIDWNFATDTYTDGPHVITIDATDSHGNVATQRVFGVNVDRHGSVYHATVWDGDPTSSDSSSSQEWYDPTTSRVRAEDGAQTWSQGPVACTFDAAGCLERHTATDGSEPDTGEADFSIKTGRAHDDVRLLGDAELEAALMPDKGSYVSTSSAASVLAIWQRPPPGNAGTYALYQTSTTDDDADGSTTEVDKLWLDTNTNLPVKWQETDDGDVVESEYYTYDASRYLDSELPTGYFDVEPSVLGGQTHTSSTQDLGPITAQEAEAHTEIDHGEQLELAADFRETYGLDSSSATVEDSIDDEESAPSGFTESVARYGVPLYPAELAHMRSRDALQDAADDLRDQLSEEETGTYGGGYLSDEGGDPTLHLLFTQISEPQEASIRSGFAYPEAIDFDTASRSLEEIEQLQDSVDSDWEAGDLDDLSVASTDIDEKANAVRVGTEVTQETSGGGVRIESEQESEEQQAAAQAELTQRYGPGVVAQAATPIQPTSYWKAGEYIFGEEDATQRNTEECTSGFGGHVGKRNYQMTAGHCSPRGWTWWLNDIEQSAAQGTTVKTTWPEPNQEKSSDAESLRIGNKERSARMKVFFGKKTHYYWVEGRTELTPRRTGRTGDKACVYSRKGGYTQCETEVISTSRVGSTPEGGKLTHEMVVASNCSVQNGGRHGGVHLGDSGGPVYVSGSTSNRVKAVGIISGFLYATINGHHYACVNGRADTAISQIGYSLTNLGLTLNTR